MMHHHVNKLLFLSKLQQAMKVGAPGIVLITNLPPEDHCCLEHQSTCFILAATIHRNSVFLLSKGKQISPRNSV